MPKKRPSIFQACLLVFLLLTIPLSAFPHPTDNEIQWSIGSRLQLDRTQFDNDQTTDLNNSWNIRRARLSGELLLWESWQLDLTYDFARDGITGVRDAYLEYRGFRGFDIRAGHFKEPFSSERLTSVQDLSAMERSLATTIAPSRSVGVAIQRSRDEYTLGLGVFSGDLDQSTNITRYGATGRATIAPYHEDGHIAHVGVSLAYRQLENDKSLRFDQRMETRSSNQRLIDSGAFSTDSYWLYGFEAAFAHNNLALRAEYLQALIPDARPTSETIGQQLKFAGWHIYASWIMTGESQPYNQQKGTLGRVRPAEPVEQGGIGAWKLGCRLSEMDLNDGFINGGRQQNMTLSLTWLLNQHYSFILEHVEVLKLDQGPFDGAKPSLTQGRLQIIF